MWSPGSTGYFLNQTFHTLLEESAFFPLSDANQQIICEASSQSIPLIFYTVSYCAWSFYYFFVILKLNSNVGNFLVAQWLRICLPMQGTVLDPWYGKIPHVLGQLSRNYWAYTQESMSCNCWAHTLQLLKHMHPRAQSATREATMRSPGTTIKE